MDDLERYIQKRSEHNTDFTQTLWNGYDEFKIGVLLKEARNEAGLTQDQVAQMLCTQKQRSLGLKITHKTSSYPL